MLFWVFLVLVAVTVPGCEGVLGGGLSSGAYYRPTANSNSLCEAAVKTASGDLVGEREANTDTCVWRGIPYAAPPVGDLRWKAPQPVKPWSGVRKAVDWGARCMQQGVMDSINYDPSGKQSEDCLFLNIWRPDRKGSFPVMVWIYGGAYTGGTANTPMYWGDRMADEHDVVLVALNYRVGAFGFLAREDLRQEDPNQSTGNYGTLDQIAALEWVQQNIDQFGGDPQNVTIFGESAGGWSVCTLLASPLAKGLYHRAILQSGDCQITHTLELGYKQSATIAKQAGCEQGGLTCLRKLSADTVLKHTAGLGKSLAYTNHIDNHLLDEPPLQSLRAGTFNKVPLLIGSTKDEFRFVKNFFLDIRGGKAFYDFFVSLIIGAPLKMNKTELEQLLALYPAAAYNYSQADGINDMIQDIALKCPTYLGALAASKHTPTYLYRFDYDKARVQLLLNWYMPMYANHGVEIGFIFNTMDRKPVSLALGSLEQSELDAMSKIMSGYWTTFAKTGAPGAASLPPWSKLDAAAPAAQTLSTTVGTQFLSSGATSFDARCKFWDPFLEPGTTLDTMGLALY
jgi:para-nitrobenzyl esterase